MESVFLTPIVCNWCMRVLFIIFALLWCLFLREYVRQLIRTLANDKEQTS